VIDAASKTEDIALDVLCIHDALRGVIKALVDATQGDKHLASLSFAAQYMAEQASAAADAFYARAYSGRSGAAA
jgi:hypothetical protein